jgi:hypothetical protein
MIWILQKFFSDHLFHNEQEIQAVSPEKVDWYIWNDRDDLLLQSVEELLQPGLIGGCAEVKAMDTILLGHIKLFRISNYQRTLLVGNHLDAKNLVHKIIRVTGTTPSENITPYKT